MVIGVFIHVLLGSVFSYHCPTVFFKNTNFVNIMFNGFCFSFRGKILFLGMRHSPLQPGMFWTSVTPSCPICTLWCLRHIRKEAQWSDHFYTSKCKPTKHKALIFDDNFWGDLALHLVTLSNNWVITSMDLSSWPLARWPDFILYCFSLESSVQRNMKKFLNLKKGNFLFSVQHVFNPSIF